MAVKTKTTKISTSRIVLVTGDDWQGLYIDGKLVEETHTLPAFMILGVISKTFGISYSELSPDSKWLDKVGSLPENLSDVKKAR